MGEPVSEYRRKDVFEWSPEDVALFITEHLPAAKQTAVLAEFKYTRGKILANLSREDLRRQCKGDQESSDLIWNSLHKFRRLISKPPKSQGIWDRYPETMSLLIRTGDDRRFEVHDICPTETVGSLKEKILELTAHMGPQGLGGTGRLTYKGGLLADDRTLASLGGGFGDGAELRWISRIENTGMAQRPARVVNVPFRM
eukprot:gnl/MRDRNA2_/MRDRNA2_88908_c0_seq1.p1 gnl/MRDRNA2_/MRDRNA2_88908_c0~~gnl/MRDRNA2_/MRDRNA2_88908_c0_seq1.p1  ORF type:complete len:199 (+),score=34.57 gnl/MRDRNA2_/MRDRNA2_88908_c0_seq1:63-659(+)